MAIRSDKEVQNFWEWLQDEQTQPGASKTHKNRPNSHLKSKSPKRKKREVDRNYTVTASRSPHRNKFRTTSESRMMKSEPRRQKQKMEASRSTSRIEGRRRKPGNKKHQRKESSKSQKSADLDRRSRSNSYRRPKKNRRPVQNTSKSSDTIAFLKEVLGREIVFQRFGLEVIDEVIGVMYKVIVKTGETMIRQGEVGDTYYVVEEGHFHIRVTEPSGKIKLVAEALRGNAIGDASLFYNTPRRATLEASEDSIVWALDAAEFRKIRQRWSQRENKKLEKIRNVLKKVHIFKQQTTDELTNIAKTMKEETMVRGESIITQGDASDKFYVIRKGTATVMKSPTRGTDKEPVMVGKYEPGHFFGECGLLHGERRAATVIATSDIRCFVWDSAAFRKYIAVGYTESIFRQTIDNYRDVNEPETKPWKNRLKTKLHEFINLGVLGVGSFGRVSLVKCPTSHHTYSLKSVRKNRVVETGQQEHMKNERLVMTLLNSKFTVRLDATFQDERRVYFLMEAVLGGELFTVLRFNRKFSERTAKFYAGCCVLAFEHMHSKNIIYRDLKPENLLLTEKGYIKLTDFGFAKKRNNTSTLCGTPEYLSPEVIRNWTQSFAVDWWTLGILIYEMIVSHPPFDDDDSGKKMYEKILTSPVKYPRTVSRTARDLIDKLLKKNAYQRLGAAPNGGSFVKRHQWWKQFDWDLLERQDMETPYIPRIQNREDLSNYESYPDEEVDDPLCADPESEVFSWARDF